MMAAARLSARPVGDDSVLSAPPFHAVDANHVGAGPRMRALMLLGKLQVHHFRLFGRVFQIVVPSAVGPLALSSPLCLRWTD